MRSRCVTFAGVTFAVEYQGEAADRILTFLYGRLPPGASGAPALTYRLLQQGNTLHLYREGRLIYRGGDLAFCANLLLGNSCRHLAATSREGLVFHAALLVRQGLGVLVPGTIGAGKTTLAARLVEQGLTYLTDELAFVPLGSERVQGFTRPFNLKPPALELLRREYGASPGCERWSGRGFDLLAPECLGTVQAGAAPPLRLLLFPHYEPAAVPVARRLTSGQAALALMSTLVNARNLPEHGLGEVARLARMSTACALHYGAFDQVEREIDDLLGELTAGASEP
ncbi:MAG: hypothetical protein ACLFU8_13580 [Anaerolineales bacterium]